MTLWHYLGLAIGLVLAGVILRFAYRKDMRELDSETDSEWMDRQK